MTNKEEAAKNAEQTLISLDQLSQTLEVMTCVVDRLKHHLTRQLCYHSDLFPDDKQGRAAENAEFAKNSRRLREESLIVEITQQEMEDGFDPELLH
ncbi:MAG: hypothetical protein RQ899_13390 [Pseudomonadales bacterium]|nr:hypothetical protein [Pseudomonadales bacterium]